MTVDLQLWIGLILVISYSVILKKIKSETASEVSYVLFIIWFNILTILCYLGVQHSHISMRYPIENALRFFGDHFQADACAAIWTVH